MRGSLNATFWNQFSRLPCFPDKCGCEPFTSEIILQPYNTISNIFMLLLALYLIYKYRNEKNHFFVLGIILTYAALGSAFLHSSFTFLGMILDFTGITSIMAWSLLIFYIQSSKRLFYTLLIVIFVKTMAMFIWVETREIIPFTLAIFTAYYFIIIKKFLVHFWRDTNFIMSIASLLLGVCLFLFDKNRIYCPEVKFFQGHTIWHVLVAIGIYNYYRFVKRNNLLQT